MKNVKPSENAQRIIDFLGCRCEYFPPSANDKKLINKYFAVSAKCLQEGCTPVIINPDDVLTDHLTSIVLEGKSPQQFREELLSKSSEGGKQLIEDLIGERNEEMAEDGFSEAEIIGEITGGEAVCSFAGHQNYHDGSITETILAYIPTAKPYEVFAWLPFGGWNDCPDAEDMIKVARYWYEKHSAVPVVISHDTLEFICRSRPHKKEAALALAKEQYALCPDIVDQGIETVGALADTLMQSTVWFFWWD